MFLGFISVQLALDGKIMPGQLAVPAVAAAIFIVLHIVMRIFVPSADGLLLPIAAALTFLGLVMIQRLDSKQAFYQLIWIAVAAVCFILVIVFERNYESLAQYKYILGLTAIVLLMSTMFIGKEVNGARLWLQIGPMHFQPSELAKVLLVVFLAAFFAEKHELLTVSTHRVLGVPVPELKYFIPLMLMWGVSVAIMIFQKDLG